MSNKVTTEVQTPAEYRDAVDAADTLGLDVDHVEFVGTWTAQNGDPVYPRADEVLETGRKYFTIVVDGIAEKVHIAEFDRMANTDAALRVTFR